MTPGEQPESSKAGQPLSYHRVDRTPTDWRSVGSFSNIGEWHYAKSVLERNSVLTRMGENPNDPDATLLLVSVTDLFWAAELIRRSLHPEQKIEQAMGFPVVSDKPKPPPLPKWIPQEIKTPLPVIPVTSALQVVDFQVPANNIQSPRYGCALAILWTMLLAGVVLLVMIAFAN
jgi:hypothetical protein